ncbi:bleomycin hydrolase-like isoform X2 [Dreissena polymorpha]|uniref:Bleomycin hydrolase n=1 Tax=Dreissena polymorpha TaxID=45954 RepID=A0A9D4ND52_DREPO|nr:bleomycin hydrolase-like isoform X2 [Dreissena polymorpha]KAH3891087.1 hypothetical protein DPMN_015176 [Dreissena polymorpha]
MSQSGLSQKQIDQFEESFSKNDKYQLAQNVCNGHPLAEMLASRPLQQSVQHCFNNTIEKEGQPITDQQRSGRCWIFACLNIMRVPFMKKYKLEKFEFSQNYLFFWDKVERANYLLHAFVECARKGETYNGRLISHMLRNPSEDGGQWDMLVNLVEKYGVVPKECFPNTWSADNSHRLGQIMNNRLREGCSVLHGMVAAGKTEAEIETAINGMNEEIYRIMCIVLGKPPRTVMFQYMNAADKGKEGETTGAKKTHSIGPISPRDFYHQLVKPDCMDMEDLVCIVNDPRPNNPYNKLYTVEYLGNMTGGKPTLYINQPIEVLKQLTIKSIKEAQTPVWFGCDVGKHYNHKLGFLDLKALDFQLMFDVDTLKLGKAERLMYGESLMTHAMVFTAVNTSDSGAADKWRVENSWGDKDGDKGYLVMSDDWFSEFVYEVVVSRKLIQDPSILAVLDQEPVRLPAWDPMGALAH